MESISGFGAGRFDHLIGEIMFFSRQIIMLYRPADRTRVSLGHGFCMIGTPFC